MGRLYLGITKDFENAPRALWAHSDTITFNDFAPEMLADARRGPFAEPDEVERVEYLLTRLRSERTRVDHENYALEHV